MSGDDDRSGIGRRSFLGLAGVSAAALALGTGEATAAPRPGGRLPSDPFGLGIASGDPESHSIVLWTRLAPEPLAADGHGGMPRRPVTVEYEVAEDERFSRVVRRGHAVATAELAHSVHPEVAGLRPGREYFYRFRAGGHLSPPGRTRTAPAREARPGELSLALASCQAWYHGHFTAYRHLVADEPELVFFLGDYIYEYAINAANLWREGVTVGPAHDADVQTLEQYRLRYALFKTDPHLQRAHALAPWIVTWDDHEVQNNYAAEHSRYGISPEDFERRRAVAYRAYYENMPLRRAALPRGPDMRLYRRTPWGRLAEFNVLDTRQYRDDVPSDTTAGGEHTDPRRSILGAEQERWLVDGLRRSGALWNVLVQQVVLARIDRDTGPGTTFSMDQWDGFTANRDRLLGAVQRHGVDNLLVFTGDIHRHVAAELKADFTDPASATIGTELVTGSVGSDGDGAPTDGYTGLWLANPHVKFYDGRRGYVLCRMGPEALVSEFKVVDYIQRDDAAPVSTVARFVTEAGRPGLEREV
ncbi:alkaline phosphatase D family protein [Prauserella muralis]|uniref:Alkaline phosphatase n=1 Tax=Prauserella muralis TaxID=588067 RepID=A0A2V4AK98_9PSEU|nr:alkaline phosphatase D family protein [Prauserella muralis]PXY20721.1 alkaline phosphatase [Prauserella muralis]TWE29728.1 alkaline phosphatase D [Prauserella muralis]